MTDNPYQSPAEASVSHQFDWKRLFYRGLYIAGGGFAGIGLVVAVGEPALDSLPGLIAMFAVAAAAIVFHVGLIIAAVAGVGWIVTMKKRWPT